MAKFKFDLEVGFLVRAEVRRQLNNSADTLEYEYPGSSVSVREDKYLFESTFHIIGTNFPDTDEFEQTIKRWIKKIEMVAC